MERVLPLILGTARQFPIVNVGDRKGLSARSVDLIVGEAMSIK